MPCAVVRRDYPHHQEPPECQGSPARSPNGTLWRRVGRQPGESHLCGHSRSLEDQERNAHDQVGGLAPEQAVLADGTREGQRRRLPRAEAAAVRGRAAGADSCGGIRRRRRRSARDARGRLGGRGLRGDDQEPGEASRDLVADVAHFQAPGGQYRRSDAAAGQAQLDRRQRAGSQGHRVDLSLPVPDGVDRPAAEAYQPEASGSRRAQREAREGRAAPILGLLPPPLAQHGHSHRPDVVDDAAARLDAPTACNWTAWDDAQSLQEDPLRAVLWTVGRGDAPRRPLGLCAWPGGRLQQEPRGQHHGRLAADGRRDHVRLAWSGRQAGPDQMPSPQLGAAEAGAARRGDEDPRRCAERRDAADGDLRGRRADEAEGVLGGLGRDDGMHAAPGQAVVRLAARARGGQLVARA